MSPSRSEGFEQSGRAVSCAVVSTDRGFVEALQSSPPFKSGAVRVDAEIRTPYPDITDADLKELRRVDPDVVILDLEPDLAIGLKFAEFLVEAEIGRVLLASAPPVSPELLLEVMHAGISDFLPRPLTDQAVERSLKTVRRRLGKGGDPGQERTPGQVLVFFSAKGGTGCTTLCTNTGVAVHRASRRKTLLLDLDLELGETALQLGEEPRFNMVDLVRNFHRVDSDLLASYIEHHESGVDLLSAPYQPTDFEAMSGERVSQILDFLRLQYDYIFVDVPRALNPALNPASVAAIETADQLVLVTTPDLPSIRNLTRCLPLLKSLGKDRPDDWIRVVVNRYDPRGMISPRQVEETIGHPVYAAVRNDYKAVMAAINESKPAVTVGSSNFAEDIADLAAKIAGVSRESKGGWLKGLTRSFRRKRRGASPQLSEVKSVE